MSQKTNSIKVAVCSIEQLFNNHKIYDQHKKLIQGELNIPAYQRPYIWNHKQISRLIEDIKEHYYNFDKSPYYLGSIILHSNNQLLDIIDGQQRLTTLAILGFLNGKFTDLQLRYQSSLSEKNIKNNFQQLEKSLDEWKDIINFSQLEISLVVTQSEDDAYKFFETQNTGGVRLMGSDIIKAHHLRAIQDEYRNYYAKKWESLGNLNATVMALLRGRYWNNQFLKIVPYYQEKRLIRDAIVSEFAEKTHNCAEDIAFNKIQVIYSPINNYAQQILKKSYHLRQPINAGINCVSYLSYFQNIYMVYYKNLDTPHLEKYIEFMHWLKKLKGCHFLETLYVACLMLYISQFGEIKIEIFSKKLFRVVYSKRVTNTKAVRSDSIPAFLKIYPVLDLINLSFTPEQSFQYLDQFDLKLEAGDSINTENNSVRLSFVKDTNDFFGLGLTENQLSENFIDKLNKAVKNLG